MDIFAYLPQLEVAVLAAVIVHLLYKACIEWQLQSSSSSQAPSKKGSNVKQTATLLAERLQEDPGQLNIMDLSFHKLPAVSGLEQVTKLAIQMHVSDVHLDAMTNMTKLEELTIAGACLTRHNLSIISKLPSLWQLDLRACRTIVQHDNTVEGFLKAEDLYKFQAERQLDTLLLPAHASFEIGKIVKVFSKAQVVVVGLEQPLRLGDMIHFQRINQDFSKSNSHRWTSRTTTIDSIRTDDHTQLTVAIPSPKLTINDVDNQVAFKAVELGQKGDSVLWSGHAAIRPINLNKK
eukprot:TRINITY_DN17282_c0_g1_i2.p1 TRINITY_DN17282_c0_g1~~TRINITY_DN17282_c0_g1_i2.p1  ORF type:complete len:292 (+),score=47.38 TRINITY_DN17282_c0_g1_i2:20-895(+)